MLSCNQSASRHYPQSITFILTLLPVWLFCCKGSSPLPAFFLLGLFPDQVRITGGRTPYEGRVEVLRTNTNGTQHWGLICGEGWGTKEAMVVCRQLGLGYSNHGMQVGYYH